MDIELDADRYRAVFSAIDEGYCVCEMIVDADGTARDYRFLETNPLFEEMTGLHQPVGRTALELVPGLEDEWIETYGRVALGGERLRFQQGSDAMGRWFDVFAMPLARPRQFAIVFKDDTARHVAEAALRESEARYRELADREHQISRRLQRALLPADVVRHPSISIIATYSAAAEQLEVGGDWYDTYQWSTHEIGVMVGDVVGHSLDAAVAMGHLRAGVAALAPRAGPRPSAWLAALQECAFGPNGTDFVTACCVVVDTDQRALTYSAAGHPPALVVSRTGTTTWLDGAQSPPLGTLGPFAAFPQRSIELEPGTTVILYSDGLVERPGESIDEGMQRLRSLAPEIMAMPDEQISHHIVDRMGEGSGFSDDVVVVALRCQATPDA
ncbi:MAG: SpoIIE family protein phosphatase [Actinobacteria bacterium]|nr:SpoIIE family protein phosphatase [Actinomycetota bacterium]